MKQISQIASLSKTYNNHSVRTTGISLLSSQFQDTDIQKLSGHKSLTALAMYKRSNPRLMEDMSKCISMSGDSLRINDPAHQPCCSSSLVETFHDDVAVVADDEYVLLCYHSVAQFMMMRPLLIDWYLVLLFRATRTVHSTLVLTNSGATDILMFVVIYIC
jgi:hypothetical protein